MKRWGSWDCRDGFKCPYKPKFVISTNDTNAASIRKRLFSMVYLFNHRICTNPSFFCTLDRVLRAT